VLKLSSAKTSYPESVCTLQTGAKWLDVALYCTTVDGLVLTGHGHLIEYKTLAVFGDSVIPCRHSGGKPFQRG